MQLRQLQAHKNTQKHTHNHMHTYTHMHTYAVQERALDKAMRREFTVVDEDLRDVVMKLYRDR
jgi:hypothetical protein